MFHTVLVCSLYSAWNVVLYSRIYTERTPGEFSKRGAILMNPLQLLIMQFKLRVMNGRILALWNTIDVMTFHT